MNQDSHQIFSNFDLPQAICREHSSVGNAKYITFLDVSDHTSKKIRTWCEDCQMIKPINLRKCNSLIKDLNTEFQEQYNIQIEKTKQEALEEIRVLEKKIQQILLSVKKEIEDRTKQNQFDPFYQMKNLTAYQIKDYQNAAEILSKYYDLGQNKINLNLVQQVFTNCIKELTSTTNKIRQLSDVSSSIFPQINQHYDDLRSLKMKVKQNIDEESSYGDINSSLKSYTYPYSQPSVQNSIPQQQMTDNSQLVIDNLLGGLLMIQRNKKVVYLQLITTYIKLIYTLQNKKQIKQYFMETTAKYQSFTLFNKKFDEYLHMGGEKLLNDLGQIISSLEISVQYEVKKFNPIVQNTQSFWISKEQTYQQLRKQLFNGLLQNYNSGSQIQLKVNDAYDQYLMNSIIECELQVMVSDYMFALLTNILRQENHRLDKSNSQTQQQDISYIKQQLESLN